MKVTVICAAIALSGTFLSLLAMGEAEDKSCCPFCSAKQQTTESVAEKKGADMNEVAQTVQSPTQQTYTCLLSAAQLEERRAATNTQILAKAEEIVETNNGYKLKFAEADDEMVTTLVEWINFERKCCNFLRFDLAFEQFSGPVWLEVGGDAAAKQFLKKVVER